jgi:hypothetical protein
MVLVFGILGFVGKAAVPLVGWLGVETAGGFFSFFLSFFFFAALGLMDFPLQVGPLK